MYKKDFEKLTEGSRVTFTRHFLNAEGLGFLEGQLAEVRFIGNARECGEYRRSNNEFDFKWLNHGQFYRWGSARPRAYFNDDRFIVLSHPAPAADRLFVRIPLMACTGFYHETGTVETDFQIAPLLKVHNPSRYKITAEPPNTTYDSREIAAADLVAGDIVELDGPITLPVNAYQSVTTRTDEKFYVLGIKRNLKTFKFYGQRLSFKKPADCLMVKREDGERAEWPLNLEEVIDSGFLCPLERATFSGREKKLTITGNQGYRQI